MKKFTIGFLVFAMVAIITVFAFAQRGDKGKHERGFGHRGFERMAEKLNLTDAQKAQVKQISEASRAKVKPLRENMRANRQQLKSLTENESFNEVQVQTIANQQGAIAAQIIVEKERTKWEIFQILTVEQRAQAKQLKEQMEERFKGRFNKSDGEDF